ncbi:hypothetical protein B0H14DRAFT_3504796 [Mycena olivaceomarginata]|nr:hypothetical protein B0H14DRAFT_3504796 [Mycena olivaceomarginata]
MPTPTACLALRAPAHLPTSNSPPRTLNAHFECPFERPFERPPRCSNARPLRTPAHFESIPTPALCTHTPHFERTYFVCSLPFECHLACPLRTSALPIKWAPTHRGRPPHSLEPRLIHSNAHAAYFERPHRPLQTRACPLSPFKVPPALQTPPQRLTLAPPASAPSPAPPPNSRSPKSNAFVHPHPSYPPAIACTLIGHASSLGTQARGTCEPVAHPRPSHSSRSAYPCPSHHARCTRKPVAHPPRMQAHHHALGSSRRQLDVATRRRRRAGLGFSTSTLSLLHPGTYDVPSPLELFTLFIKLRLSVRLSEAFKLRF